MANVQTLSIINTVKLNMKKLALLFLLVAGTIRSQENTFTAAVIPIPNAITYTKVKFGFSPQTQIILADESLGSDVKWFNDHLEKNYGYRLPIAKVKPAQGNYIEFVKPDFEAGWREKYHMDITDKSISIMGEGGGSGAFYGLVTLTHLLPIQEKPTGKLPPEKMFVLPGMKIIDGPRFEWRGMHLDVSRHFFNITFIKKYLDLMAMYKMNSFHWHLTDDQGWRIEIKKYPLLTKVGGWRSGTVLGIKSKDDVDTSRYGGFYTQEEIKEVVKYAEKLHINVVPEIEMPGHSQAAIAAYPWLSCTGKKIEVAKGWGVFNDVYCTKDSTFQFLEDVLDEVMALFPSKYIHIGGDECPKARWKECRNCKSLMKKEKLKTEEELQSFFTRRIENYVNSKGRQIIGWDEILEGGLAPNAAVMSWRGTKGGIEAAKQKHFVVMSPGQPCYFDHYQSKFPGEPHAIGGYNPVDSVYLFDPMPAGLKYDEEEFILGAQGNLWTEYIMNEKQAEYMAVPRMPALAEALWTKKDNKDLEDFRMRLKINSRKLDQMQVKYAKHFLNKR